MHQERGAQPLPWTIPLHSTAEWDRVECGVAWGPSWVEAGLVTAATRAVIPMVKGLVVGGEQGRDYSAMCVSHRRT